MTIPCQTISVYQGIPQGSTIQITSTTDPGSGQTISTHEWILDSTALPYNTNIITIDTSSLTIGIHTLQLNAQNSCGNSGSYSQSFYISESPCVPNWVCEYPLNGYESDGCGNRRLNSACNPCVPNWMCEYPLNGYETDGCGNRRLNSACNPCTPNWQCELPLNGYESDGCGNRRLNLLCGLCVPDWMCEYPLNGYERDGCGNRRQNPQCNPICPNPEVTLTLTLT